MIAFEKWHGAGNDFVIVEADAPIGDRREFAVRECDRERGIGADGVLFLDLSPGAPPRVEMALYQPDGSTAAMCGNGARCAAKWAAERTGADVVIVDTPAGERRATIDGDDVTVEMGTVSFDPRTVPVAGDEALIDSRVGDLLVTAVNTGVPHAVSFVDDVDDIELESVAPAIRHAEVFPEGANVTLASPSTSGFRQRTFERGVEGETVACGTGAVAVAAVARRRGLIEADEPVTVTPPGGDLVVTVREDWTATLHGPVEKAFEGELELA